MYGHANVLLTPGLAGRCRGFLLRRRRPFTYFFRILEFRNWFLSVVVLARGVDPILGLLRKFRPKIRIFPYGFIDGFQQPLEECLTRFTACFANTGRFDQLMFNSHVLSICETLNFHTPAAKADVGAPSARSACSVSNASARFVAGGPFHAKKPNDFSAPARPTCCTRVQPIQKLIVSVHAMPDILCCLAIFNALQSGSRCAVPAFIIRCDLRAPGPRVLSATSRRKRTSGDALISASATTRMRERSRSSSRRAA